MGTLILRITVGANNFLHEQARIADASELVGVLSRPLFGNAPIDGVHLLPAEAGASFAVADGAAIRQVVCDLQQRHRTAVSLVHSHGDHDSYHSPTDDETIFRLLPAMAQPLTCLDRPVPQVFDQDQAVLPLANGRRVTFQVIGRAVGLNRNYRTAWTSVTTEFRASLRRPRAVWQAGTLRLESGGMSITLGLPIDATLSQSVSDPAANRVAYSLVVNNRGEHFAEALVVCEVCGTQLLSKVACDVEIVPGKVPESNKPNEHFLSYEEVASFRGQRHAAALVAAWSNGDDQ